jgi:leucyl/phenylalanyl-tRNA--protein transferase
MLPWLRAHMPFPPVELALEEPNGLLAASEPQDLSAQRLLMAYQRGIFPWYSHGQPVLWWSPNPRMVLFVDEFHVSHSLRKRVRQNRFELRINTAFRRVMEHCAEPRRGETGTWITDEMLEAYCGLHTLGYAHSFESWRHGELVGGLYGVHIGRMFFGESMFARETDASKVALVHLVHACQRANIPMIDCQQETRHLASFGARPIARSDFVARVMQLVA